MNPRHIRHRVERTKNKHSRAVVKDGTIIIRLAKNLSKSEEKEHIEDLLKRMKDQVLDEQKRILINPFRKILNEGESCTITLATGKKYFFTLKPGKRTSLTKTTRGWRITISPKVRRKGLHRLLWKVISQAEFKRIEALVNHLNQETFGVHVSDVRLAFATTQWGSCSPRGIIMINSALLFAPPSLLKYVIIHELAHRKRGDHSPSYWQWVEWGMPSYKKARRELLEYRLPDL